MKEETSEATVGTPASEKIIPTPHTMFFARQDQQRLYEQNLQKHVHAAEATAAAADRRRLQVAGAAAQTQPQPPAPRPAAEPAALQAREEELRLSLRAKLPGLKQLGATLKAQEQELSASMAVGKQHMEEYKQYFSELKEMHNEAVARLRLREDPEDRERISKLIALDGQMRVKCEELRTRQAENLKAEDALRKRKEELLKDEEAYMQQFTEHRAVHQQLEEINQRAEHEESMTSGMQKLEELQAKYKEREEEDKIRRGKAESMGLGEMQQQPQQDNKETPFPPPIGNNGDEEPEKGKKKDPLPPLDGPLGAAEIVGRYKKAILSRQGVFRDLHQKWTAASPSTGTKLIFISV